MTADRNWLVERFEGHRAHLRGAAAANDVDLAGQRHFDLQHVTERMHVHS